MLKGSDAISSFTWREKTVDFSIEKADVQQKETAMKWTVDSTQGDIPPVGNLHFRINLWLVKGNAPLAGKGCEVQIKMFAFDDKI